MPTTALYRINGGEVVKISLAGQTFADRNTTYWGVLTDPTTPDGTEVLDTNDNPRVFGFAKFADVAGTTVRNATQPELDNYPVAQGEDEALQDADRAKEMWVSHPQFRKLFKAFADILVDEHNIWRAWLRDFKIEVAAATSLADFKTRVAGMDDTPDRTLVQLRAAILARISEDD